MIRAFDAELKLRAANVGDFSRYVRSAGLQSRVRAINPSARISAARYEELFE